MWATHQKRVEEKRPPSMVWIPRISAWHQDGHESGTSLHRWVLRISLHHSLWFPCQAPLADWLCELLLSSERQQATTSDSRRRRSHPCCQGSRWRFISPSICQRPNCCRTEVQLWGAWLCLSCWNISPAKFRLWPPEVELLECSNVNNLLLSPWC